MFKRVRSFFEEKGVVEVDVPSLARGACIDQHINLIEATVMGERAFLHSSPEYYMKRLLAEGIGDCYQLSHVFRDGEVSERHNPEFTMLEWYRLGFSLTQMIEESLALASVFIEGGKKILFLTHKEVFVHFLGYYPENQEEREHFFAFDLDEYLAKEDFVVIHDFPKEEAALAQIEGEVAKRFEIFYQGLEIANGYLELQDPDEHRLRLKKANEKRNKPYPVDEHFLRAMEKGLPACAGVAMGFDRLMMIKYKAPTIKHILPFAFEYS
jgi:lysyl-tRNA synthetase class 2